jgi:hypothetical protein
VNHDILVECLTSLSHGRETHAFAFLTVGRLGHVVQTKDHVLRRNGNWTTVRRRKDVMARKHEQLRFEGSIMRKRNVNSHLVTIEVGVESRTNERVQTDRFTFDQHRLEGLNTRDGAA